MTHVTDTDDVLKILKSSFGGALRRSWLRQRATSLKVAGSIPLGVTGIFH